MSQGIPDFRIETYKFKKPVISESNKLLADDEFGVNWPVVYVLHGKKQLYVGETTSANTRMEQHLNPSGNKYEKRKLLDTAEIICNKTFNKSAILDIEQELIRLYGCEIARYTSQHRFEVLQNENRGQSKLHNYYNRSFYQQQVKAIWSELKRKGLAQREYDEITNDILFKFSPYTNLNEEQKTVSLKIIGQFMDVLEARDRGEMKDFTAVVNGAAGTGKTIVLLYVFRFILEALASNQTDFELADDEDIPGDEYDLEESISLINRIKKYARNHNNHIRIAYVAQMSSLRSTIKTVLRSFNYHWGMLAIGPSELVSAAASGEGIEPYDIVLVDESHRLCRRKSISWMGAFDNNTRKLYGNDVDLDSVTTLDWIMKCSKTRVLVYDSVQTVKDSDITPSQFEKAMEGSNRVDYVLHQQMRCRAGDKYLSYLSDIFDCKPGLERTVIDNYDFKYFDDPNQMISEIVGKNGEYGLSKVVAGYGWQWDRQKYDSLLRECNQQNISDRESRVDHYLNNLKNEDDGLIVFGDKKYVRNLDYNWLLSGSPREIGCIHTSQGYDLNYVGVLFGPEIDYKDGRLVVKTELVKDSCISTSLRGLSTAKQEEKIKRIINYILNAYKVMMERGIHGCYMYAANHGLAQYLSKYVPVWQSQTTD